MKKVFSKLPVYGFTIAFLFISNAGAQEFSYDGNRWYEVEISVFSNANRITEYPETFYPEDFLLSYPDNILQLEPASAAYQLEFEQEAVVEPEYSGNQGSTQFYNDSKAGFGSPQEMTDAAILDQTVFGPQYSPAEYNFHIPDFSKDPFIALDERFYAFANYNNRIIRSGEHRLLFHAVWRQPVLNKVQSTAVNITGGELFGQHWELEGYITISYNVNRIDADLNLWLSAFWPDFDDEVNDEGEDEKANWQLPLSPFAEVVERHEMDEAANNTTSSRSYSEFEPEYIIDSISVLQQTRSMISNSLHYIDHPDFGVLIEVRPYQLPDDLDDDLE